MKPAVFSIKCCLKRTKINKKSPELTHQKHFIITPRPLSNLAYKKFYIWRWNSTITDIRWSDSFTWLSNKLVDPVLCMLDQPLKNPFVARALPWKVMPKMLSENSAMPSGRSAGSIPCSWIICLAFSRTFIERIFRNPNCRNFQAHCLLPHTANWWFFKYPLLVSALDTNLGSVLHDLIPSFSKSFKADGIMVTSLDIQLFVVLQQADIGMKKTKLYN